MGTPQTSESLNPKVTVKGFVEQSPFQGISRDIMLAGHVIDTAGVIGAGTPLYTPILVGQITSKASAVAVCNSLGLTYTFTSFNVLDLTTTDELATMLIYAGMQFEDYAASRARYALEPCNFYVGVLGTPATNTKTTDPWGDATAGTDLLTLAEQAQTPIDLFVCPYEYAEADFSTAGNYFESLKAFCESRINSGVPTLGQNWAVFADITTLPSALTDFDNTAFENSTNFSFPSDTGTTSAGIVGATMSVHMVGMQQPFFGRHGEVLPNLPTPSDNSKVITSDQANTLLQLGWSPIRVNPITDVVYSSRIVSALLEDPVTLIARDYLLDYQDFKIFYLNVVNVYNDLVTSDVINDRFTVNKSGQSPVLNQVRNITIAEDTSMFHRGMVAVDPKFYADQYTAKLDSQNINRIVVTKPLYPSSIVYIIDTSVTTRNFVPLLKSFNILV